MTKNSINVFLSHSDIDKEIAGSIKEKLGKYEINVFLAHTDLEGGTEWESKLFAEIQNCDLFLILLTENYHSGRFTDQETGIALSFPKPILPICIDKTRPYGFMSRYQGLVCKPDFPQNNIDKIVKRCKALTKTEPSIIDMLIKRLRNAHSFSEAHSISKMIEEHREFTSEQIHALSNAYLENLEVSHSYMAAPIILRILEQNRDKIDMKIHKLIF